MNQLDKKTIRKRGYLRKQREWLKDELKSQVGAAQRTLFERLIARYKVLRQIKPDDSASTKMNLLKLQETINTLRQKSVNSLRKHRQSKRKREAEILSQLKKDKAFIRALKMATTWHARTYRLKRQLIFLENKTSRLEPIRESDNEE